MRVIVKLLLSSPFAVLSVLALYWGIVDNEILGGMALAFLFGIVGCLPWAKSGFEFTRLNSAGFSIFLLVFGLFYFSVSFEIIDSNWWYQPECSGLQSRYESMICVIHFIIDGALGRPGMRIVALLISSMLTYFAWKVWVKFVRK